MSTWIMKTKWATQAATRTKAVSVCWTVTNKLTLKGNSHENFCLKFNKISSVGISHFSYDLSCDM
jgi:hypothetical protein